MISCIKKANLDKSFIKDLEYDSNTIISMLSKDICRIKTKKIILQLKLSKTFKAEVISCKPINKLSVFEKKYPYTSSKSVFVDDKDDESLLNNLINGIKINYNVIFHKKFLEYVQDHPRYNKYFYSGKGKFHLISEYGMMIFSVEKNFRYIETVHKINVYKDQSSKPNMADQKVYLVNKGNDYQIEIGM